MSLYPAGRLVAMASKDRLIDRPGAMADVARAVPTDVVKGNAASAKEYCRLVS
jgi:hypothetical protein